jgi:hypothetical protein
LSSFQTGNPEQVYRAALGLIKAYNESLHDVAKLRFTANFGSPICENCNGLKAGPGVIATCYQVKACNYDNIREDSVGQRHLRVLENLLTDHKTP